jgi:general transcription factor 3C polypeptide 3 (transcription factor C subunit 4)
MFAHQFNNEPLRILLASLASGLNQTDQLVSSTLQKYLLRELRMMLAAAKGKQLMWNNACRRYAPAQSDKLVDAEAEGEDDVDGDADEEERGAAESAQKGAASVNDRFAVVNRPTKENPVIVTIYAQACTVVRSYQSALCKSCLCHC